MSLKTENLKFLLMKTLTDLVKSETDDARKQLMELLLEQYEDTGTKSFSVQIPGAEKVATFTLAEPKPTHKVDDAALLAWCLEHRPDLVETVEHEEVVLEAWTEKRLAEGAAALVTSEYKLAGTMYVTDEGEPVDGVEYVPAGTPKSFAVRYEKGGQERVVEAWRDGELAGIEPGKNLPQIGRGEAAA
jgi:hypothetical protein